MRALGRRAAAAGPARPCCEAAWSPRSPFPPAALAWRGIRRRRSRRRNRRPTSRRSAGPASLLVAFVGAQRGVGGEQDALRQADRRALAEARDGVTSSRSCRAPTSRAGRPRSACRTSRPRPRGGGPSASCRAGCRRPDGPCRRRCRRQKPAAAERTASWLHRVRPRRRRRSRRLSTLRRGNQHGPRRHRSRSRAGHRTAGRRRGRSRQVRAIGGLGGATDAIAADCTTGSDVLRARDTDRLERVFFIQRFGDVTALARCPIDGLVGELNGHGIRCGSCDAGGARGIGADRSRNGRTRDRRSRDSDRDRQPCWNVLHDQAEQRGYRDEGERRPT